MPDAQTLRDLEIFESPGGGDTLLVLLDFTVTHGGKEKLRQLLGRFCTTREEILRVQEALQYLVADPARFDLNLRQEELFNIEYYLESNIAPVFGETHLDFWANSLRYRLLYRFEYAFIRGGTFRVLFLLQDVRQRVRAFQREPGVPVLLQTWTRDLLALLDRASFQHLLDTFATERYNFLTILNFDNLLRTDLKEAVLAVLAALYEIDAYRSLAVAVQRHQLVFPAIAEPTAGPVLQFEGLFHLALPAAVRNQVALGGGTNFQFLTGPNMAGKTTYLKACAVAVYLAHLGMAVPATRATVGVLDGICSSLTTTDYLRAGYSYFYSEVRRVKEVVQQLRTGQKLLVLFDELFRGTNVKDAYDCSLIVMEGFQQYPQSIFLLSTHITELAAELRRYPNVSYGFLESRVEAGQPRFSYQLREGVSHERLGLVILLNEEIF